VEATNINECHSDVVPVEKSVYMNGVNVQYIQSKNKSGCQKHQIVILGDSHNRGCANKEKVYLNKKFEVIGFVKSGPDNGTLTSSVKGTSEKLTKNDVIVFWGGTNDISKNNTKEGLQQLLNFVMNKKHTHIILISAPHRHDTVEWSCVNVEVIIFHRKLRKLMKSQKHVPIVSADCNREFSPIMAFI
jgi:hypothetical protein